MPAMGKELERQLSSDEIALREIQGYIDKVERQSETQQPQQQKQSPAQTQQVAVPQQTVLDITSQGATPQKPKITLPMDKAEVESGLKTNVLEGVRWLAEWCVMMIKKYPGRVFYMQKQASQ